VRTKPKLGYLGVEKLLTNSYPSVSPNLVLFLLAFLVNRQWLTPWAFNLSSGGIFFSVSTQMYKWSQRTIEETSVNNFFLFGGGGWGGGVSVDKSAMEL